ncbi:DUF2291 family protein [Marinomonas transparens]|uniref:DUF2291 family protein n=1 Tax=Marinomonas transparens TaxID=2795388 RepID=A0A934JUI4_9GAMM|nr:DUF2291 family protein [Marinomonas transparens]MBJ7538581.1 DUF2291 family protein [Marinomonas transparens]
MYKSFVSKVCQLNLCQLNTRLLKTILLSVVFASLTACHVVDLDENGKPIIPMSAADAALFKNMTPEAITEKIWPSVKQDARDKAVELSTVVENAKLVSFVRFQGVVLKLDESKLKKSLIVESSGYQIALQVGSIIKGNSIRDAMSFLSFDQFKNQIQFARLSKALNKQSIRQITQPDASWVGETVDVLAAVTITSNKVTHAVPLEIKKEGL